MTAEVAEARAGNAWEWPTLRVTRRQLASGLRVTLAENHTVPLVWLAWASPAGIEAEPAGLDGVAALAPVLLREGTTRRDAARVTEEIDALGADLVSGFDWDAAFVSLGLLACDLERGAELLVDLACRATFPPEAVARLRQRRLAETEQRRRQPRALADDEFARLLHAGTRHARPPLGLPSTLGRIQAPDVAAFHAARYRPSVSHVVLAGDFDSERAERVLAALDLPEAAPDVAPDVTDAPVAAPAAPGLRVVDVPQATHTELRVGQRGLPRDSPDLPALEVLGAVLGEGPCSRLSQALRQRAGATYDARCHVVARRTTGQVAVATSVAAAQAPAALDAIRRECARLVEEHVPESELEQAKNRLLGADLRRFQSIVHAGWTLREAAFEPDPARHVEGRRAAIAAVEPAAVRALARRLLDPGRLVALAVGPAQALRSKFSSSDAGGADAPAPLEPISWGADVRRECHDGGR